MPASPSCCFGIQLPVLAFFLTGLTDRPIENMKRKPFCNIEQHNPVAAVRAGWLWVLWWQRSLRTCFPRGAPVGTLTCARRGRLRRRLLSTKPARQLYTPCVPGALQATCTSLGWTSQLILHVQDQKSFPCGTGKRVENEDRRVILSN